MPAEQGRRLDDQQRLTPGPEVAGEQQQECPIGRGAARALDAAPEDEELLAQEGVLGDEGGTAAHEIGEGVGHHGRFGGFRRAGQALPERASA